MDNPPSLTDRVKNAVEADVTAGAHRRLLAGFGVTASGGIAALSIYYLYQYGQAAELVSFLAGIGSSVISDQLRSWAEGANKPSLEDISALLQQALDQNHTVNGALAIVNERLGLLQQLIVNTDETIKAELLTPGELEAQFRLFGTNLEEMFAEQFDRHNNLQTQLQLQFQVLAVAAYPLTQALPYYRGIATRLKQYISSGHHDTRLRYQLNLCETYISRLEQAVNNGDMTCTPPPDLRLEDILEALVHFRDNHLSPENQNSKGVMTDEGRISAFIADYQSIFGGRNRELAELDNWLAQTKKPIGLVFAQAGLGKSALVANWVSGIRAASNACVAFHPISLRYGTHRRRNVLTSLVIQIQRMRNKPLAARDADEKYLENELVSELKNDSPADKPLLVIIDGLDELDVASTQPIMLPGELGKNVHLLVTARDNLVTGVGSWCLQFGWSPTYVQVFTPGKLSMAAVQHVVQQQGILGNEQAIHQITEEVYRLSCEGDPLTTRLWINEVLDLQRSQRIPGFLSLAAVQSMQLHNREPGIEGYLVSTIRQMEQVGVKSAPLFEVLSAALGPMMAQDMQYFIPETRNLAPRQLLDVSRNLIVGDGDKVGYSFSHAEIGNAYRKLYFTKSRSQEWIQRFRDYGHSVYSQLKDRTLAAEAASEQC